MANLPSKKSKLIINDIKLTTKEVIYSAFLLFNSNNILNIRPIIVKIATMKANINTTFQSAGFVKYE